MNKSVMSLIRQVGGVIAFSLLVLACDDDSTNVTKTSDQTLVDSRNNVAVTSTTQEVISVTSGAMSSNSTTSGGRSANGRTQHTNTCDPAIDFDFTVNSYDNNSFDHEGTITIDYGDGSSCSDSNVRKGKIVDAFKLTGQWSNMVFNTTENITLTGYYLDSAQVDGNIVSTSQSTDASSAVEAKNVKITYADGTTLSWKGNYTYTEEDDSTKMTGTWSGVNRQGESFTANVTKKIVYIYSCRNSKTLEPVSGTIEEKTGDKTSIIDYGDGSCDNEYTITTNGNTVKYTFD